MPNLRLSNLLCAVLLLALAACQPPPTTVPTLAPLTAAPTPTGKIIAEWPVTDPGAIAVGFDSIWVAGHHSFSTTRIDPTTNKVIAAIPGTGFRAEQVLAVGNALWVTGQAADTTWIDPTTNTATKSVPPVKGELHDLAYGFNSLWATTSDNALARIDPATSTIIATIPLEKGRADCNNGIRVSTTAVWILECDFAELIKIDPNNNSLVSKTPWAKLIEEAQAQTTLPSGKGSDFIWLDFTSEDVKPGISVGLLRIDPNTGTGVTFLPLKPEQSTSYLAVTDTAVWLSGLNQLNRVNVATNQVEATYATDLDGSYIAVGFGSLWLANYAKSLIERLDIAP